jgi:hypothetical protein
VSRTHLAAPLLAPALALLVTGCAVGRSLLARNDDLEDYRAFRVAAHEGVRLAKAQRYLERHPQGAWAADVKRTFDDEEPLYFERATQSRAKTSEYLADLPRGPHAAAAISLLTAFDTHIEDLATSRLLRDARLTEVKLERASRQRRTLGEGILTDLAALLDPALYGARQDDLPGPVRGALGGLAPSTWGKPTPVREDDYFYAVPTHLVRESRVVTLRLALVLERTVVTLGILSGPDLFVSWDEADEVKPRDPTDDKDRSTAAAHAADLLGGALEARMPAARCTVSSSDPKEILVRRCDGWSAVVTMGRRPGDLDAITVSGPAK